MIWWMLLLLGSSAVAGNGSPSSERKKQYVSYESPDEEGDVEGNADADVGGISRALGGLDGIGDDRDDLGQMHITENSFGGLAVADGDLSPLFVGNTGGGAGMSPLGDSSLSGLPNSLGQQSISSQVDDQTDDTGQSDASNGNVGDLNVGSLGGFGDRVSLLSGSSHHGNFDSINSDSRDLDTNQGLGSDSISALNGDNNEGNIDSSVNLGEGITDSFDGVQGGLASLFTNNGNSPTAPSSEAGITSTIGVDDKQKPTHPNKQAMADALAKLLTSVSSQNGEDRQGQELNQLDVSDAKLQKMLEQGLDDDSTGPITPSSEGGGGAPVQSSDAQPSDAPDEMPSLAGVQGSETPENQFGDFGNLMQLPALHFQPGQTIHAHASDKPNDGEDHKPSPGEAAETALQVQANAQKEHRMKLKKLKDRLKLLRQKLQELEEEQAKKSHSSNSIAAKRTDAIKRLLIKNLKLAALIASKEIELEEAKGGASIRKEEEDEDGVNNDASARIKDVGSKAKPLTDLSKKAEEEVNALMKENKNKNKSVTFNFNSSSTKAKSEIFSNPENASLIKEINATLNKLKTAAVPAVSIRSYSKLVQRIAEMSNSVKKENTLPKPDSITSLASLYSALKTKAEARSKNFSPKFDTLGCWKDPKGNLISSMEPYLKQKKEKDYRHRVDPVMKCAKMAYGKGYPGFAVEDSGQCFAGPSILKMYNKEGKSVECNKYGTGGPLSLNVYKFLH